MDNREKDFITERVLDQEGSRRKKKGLLLKVIGLIAAAIAFGAIASLTFVLTKPIFEGPAQEETKPQEPVVIPQDEPETEPETPAETESTEKLEEIVESAVQSREWTISDYRELQSLLKGMAVEANRGIVTVSVSTSDTDLFENQISSVGSTSGAIWTINEEYVYILTMSQEDIEKGNLAVTFQNGVTNAAELLGIDRTCGLAVVGVPAKEVDALTRANIREIPLGNSLMTQKGDTVLFVGNPRQYVGSVDVGMISGLRIGVAGRDMEYRSLVTNISTDENSGGFLLDLKGNLIGVVLKGQAGITTEAVGISDLKGIMELLANKKQAAFLGITGLEVTDAISKNNNIPMGIYISDLKRDGPAFKAGLQTGDILIRIGKEEVMNLPAFEKTMLALSPGAGVSVTVMRVDRDTYSEETFTVILGER